MKTITKHELDKKHKLNKQYVTGIKEGTPTKDRPEPADLSNIQFHNLDLKRQLFNEASFEGSIMEHSIMNGTKLVRANLQSVNLSNSTLIEVNLKDANLSNSILNNCHIVSSNMSGTNLSNVDFTNSTLNKVDLRNAILEHSIFDNVILHKCLVTDMDVFTGHNSMTDCQLNGDLNYSILE